MLFFKNHSRKKITFSKKLIPQNSFLQVLSLSICQLEEFQFIDYVITFIYSIFYILSFLYKLKDCKINIIIEIQYKN